MPRYVLAIDQSTAGTKCVILDENGSIVSKHHINHRQITTPEGYIEHDLNEIWNNVKYIIRHVVEKSNINKDDIAMLSISNQRETVGFWDKSTGKPIHNAIVWQCARGHSISDEIEKKGYGEKIKQITGLKLSPYFSASKISWFIKNIKDYNIENLSAGTIDSWLIYKLTNGDVFATDYSNASRTQLFDLRKLMWSEEIANYFNIPISILPTPMPSDEVFGETNVDRFFTKSIPICGVMGDSHGALFGQGCVETGMTKVTYGTGSSIMTNIGDKPITTCDHVVSSIAWGRGGKVDYVLEGNINYTGAVIKWLVEDLELIDSPSDVEALAYMANRDDKSYLVPAFSGLSAPYWKSNTSAILVGMTRITKRAEIVKAGEESIAYQILDVVKCIKNSSNIELSTIRVDGGPTKDKYLMQFQSDILNMEVLVPDVAELSAVGAAYMGAIALGIYDEPILDNMKYKNYCPVMTQEVRNQKIDGWKKAVEKVLES